MLVQQHKVDCVVIAGDIFDDGWRAGRCPPELINFAIKHLKFGVPIYAIPGQHDLPNHRYADIKKSAYWTLVEAGTVINLPPGEAETVTKRLKLVGFPWKEPLADCPARERNSCYLAVVHKYIWNSGNSYPGALPADHVTKALDQLNGYYSYLFGDNHKGFTFNRTCRNNGTFLIRKRDEESYHPNVGLLRKSGDWEDYHLDMDEDRYLDLEKVEGMPLSEFENLLQTLTDLSDTSLDFEEAVKFHMKRNKINSLVQEIVFRCLGGNSGDD